MSLNLGEPFGVFEVKSGKLRVTDPCYTKDTWCAGVLENVKNGVWEAYAYMGEGFFGQRVARLTVFHRDHSSPTGPRTLLRNERGERVDIGVDSGQAGFFDEAAYPDGDRDEGGEYNKDAFYDECCNATLDSGDHGGVIRDSGVVSSSGDGDGGYDCFYWTDQDGQVVAAEIVFLEDEEESDEVDEDDHYEDCAGCGREFPEEELDIDGFCETCAEENEDAEEVKS